MISRRVEKLLGRKGNVKSKGTDNRTEQEGEDSSSEGGRHQGLQQRSREPSKPRCAVVKHPSRLSSGEGPQMGSRVQGRRGVRSFKHGGVG